MKSSEYIKAGERAFAILYRDTESAPTDPCPFCGCCHSHGSGDGFRVAHCMKDGAVVFVVAQDGTKMYQKDGYIIKTRCKN